MYRIMFTFGIVLENYDEIIVTLCQPLQLIAAIIKKKKTNLVSQELTTPCYKDEDYFSYLCISICELLI